MAIYYYSLMQDFPLNKVDLSALTNEIRRSSITIAVDYINLDADQVIVAFKASLPSPDKLLLDNNSVPAGGIIGAHQAIPLEPDPEIVQLALKQTVDRRLRVAVEKGEGDRITVISHRWNDRTTWYEKSVKVENEIAQNDGDNQTYNLQHGYLIDGFHGKLTEEDYAVFWTQQLGANAGNLRVFVEVDSGTGFEARTENFPETTNGDFSVDYVLGKILFNNLLSETDVVRVTYWYSPNVQGRSTITIKPKAGKRLTLEEVEVQFSSDTVLNDTVLFDTYGYIGFFAPHLASDTPDFVTTFPPNLLIPLLPPKAYKTMYDYMNEANKAYATYPPVGGNTWRGVQNSTVVYAWDYVRGIQLFSSAGMEIRVYLQNDTPFSGEYATATFYAVEENEDEA